MKYENKSITSDGEKLLAQSVANKQAPIIDKMLVLNTDIPLEKTIDSLTLNDFSNAISFDVNNVSQNDNSFTASAVISNNGINQDYTAKLIGITGFLNGSEDRRLFSVAQGSDPFVIEKQDGTPVTLVPSITTGFSNSENIQLTVKNDVYLTKQDLSSMGLAKQSDLKEMQTTINQSISGPDSTVSKNIAQAKTDANAYTDSIKDGLQHGIDTTNQRIDTVHDQLGGDIASAKNELSGNIGNLSNSKLTNYDGNVNVFGNSLKNYTQTGIYVVSPIDAPGNVSFGTLIVANRSAGDCNQIWISDWNWENIQYRNHMYSKWSDWQQFATNDDISALSNRIDKAQDQLGADIRDTEQRAKDDADKKIQFFDNETDAHNANLPAGTLKIVRG